jgi:hypothetical protein
MCYLMLNWPRIYVGKIVCHGKGEDAMVCEIGNLGIHLVFWESVDFHSNFDPCDYTYNNTWNDELASDIEGEGKSTIEKFRVHRTDRRASHQSLNRYTILSKIKNICLPWTNEIIQQLTRNITILRFRGMGISQHSFSRIKIQDLEPSLEDTVTSRDVLSCRQVRP